VTRCREPLPTSPAVADRVVYGRGRRVVRDHDDRVALGSGDLTKQGEGMVSRGKLRTFLGAEQMRQLILK